MDDPKIITKINFIGDEFRVDRQGAKIQMLRLDNLSLLREDEGTNTKRSGIPVLGPLVDANTGIWTQVAPSMPQHGTDRITEWRLEHETLTSVTLSRTYDGGEHPLIGAATITFSIDEPHIFSLKRVTRSSSKEPVPLGTGLHTYFSPKVRFEGLDDVFPIENGRSYHRDGVSLMHMSLEGKRFAVEAQPTPLETVVWAEDSSDHICVEPWWAQVGAAPMIQPGETRIETYTIRRIV